jgi:hypothetical protein
VLKYNHAIGPVVSWHEMDNEAESHILFMMPFFSESSSHKPLSHGWIHAIPAIAAYDSWKPTDVMSDGASMMWITRQVVMVVLRSVALCISVDISLMTMNSKARMIDALAPVANE